MAEKKVEPVVSAPRIVRATSMVFYHGLRIRAGRTFTLKTASDFNPDAMVYADGAPDETAAAVEASPKIRGSAGVQVKAPDVTPSKAAVQASLNPDPGI